MGEAPIHQSDHNTMHGIDCHFNQIHLHILPLWRYKLIYAAAAHWCPMIEHCIISLQIHLTKSKLNSFPFQWWFGSPFVAFTFAAIFWIIIISHVELTQSMLFHSIACFVSRNCRYTFFLNSSLCITIFIFLNKQQMKIHKCC